MPAPTTRHDWSNDIATFLKGPQTPASQLLIDYDSGQPVAMSARRMTPLRTELATRKGDLPALWLGIRAITLVPPSPPSQSSAWSASACSAP